MQASVSSLVNFRKQRAVRPSKHRIEFEPSHNLQAPPISKTTVLSFLNYKIVLVLTQLPSGTMLI